MDKARREHDRKLEQLAFCPEHLGLGCDELELIAVEPRMLDKGYLVAEPDLVYFGKDGVIYITEYNRSGNKRAVEQLQRAEHYFKMSRFFGRHKVELIHAFTAREGCTFDCYRVK